MMTSRMKAACLCLVLLLSLGYLFHANASKPGAPDAKLLAAAQKEYTRVGEKQLPNKRYLTIIDYKKSILEPRLWVYDQQAKCVVLTSSVSHAFNSGLLYPTSFSNNEGSNQSCAGSFITQETYQGKFGYSLRINGITKGQNTNARARAIIFHPDPGYRFSKGCFMTDKKTNQKLIDLIKNGSLVYVRK